MKNVIKVSIVTISYNAEETIAETIESVLNQKDENVEYVVVDGGSTDRTIEIIKSYGDKIDKLISEPDEGVSDAFNKGIRKSVGDIICIVNSDDILEKDAINTARCFFLEDSDIDILYGDINVFMDKVENGYLVKPDTDLTKLRYAFLTPHPGMFIARKAYEKYGLYSKKLKNAMDYELVSRMYMNGAKLHYADVVLASFREGGISQASLGRTLKEHRAVAKRNGAGIFERERYLGHVYFRRKTVPVLKKLGIENSLRRMVKKG